MRRNSGFTLIELMVTLAVLAIVLAIALPSFQGVIRNNQLTTEANMLASALQLARSEAVKRAENVSLSASGASFAGGFCVHTGATCTTAATPTQIRQYDGFEFNVGPSPTVTSIAFNSMGELVPSPGTAGVSVEISPVGCTSGEVDGMRRVFVGLGGHVSVSARDCT